MTDGPQEVPITRESVGGSLIDAARISVLAALLMIPEPVAPAIVTPGAEEMPTVHDCLEQAMQWLDGARSLTIQQGAPVTSLHVVDAAGRPK